MDFHHPGTSGASTGHATSSSDGHEALRGRLPLQHCVCHRTPLLPLVHLGDFSAPWAMANVFYFHPALSPEGSFAGGLPIPKMIF